MTPLNVNLVSAVLIVNRKLKHVYDVVESQAVFFHECSRRILFAVTQLPSGL